MNAPAGDYAEYLVTALVRGELADNSEKSWDIKTADGERLQVKCRVVHEGKRGQRELSPFRTWDFDRAVIVLFDDDYAVFKCVALPVDVVRSHWCGVHLFNSGPLPGNSIFSEPSVAIGSA
jgi:hypothetical protein